MFSSCAVHYSHSHIVYMHVRGLHVCENVCVCVCVWVYLYLYTFILMVPCHELLFLANGMNRMSNDQAEKLVRKLKKLEQNKTCADCPITNNFGVCRQTT